MKKSVVKKAGIAAAVLIVIAVLALCVIDMKCTVDFDHMLTTEELKEFESRNDIFIHGVGMTTIEKDTGKIGSGLIVFSGYDNLESELQSTARDIGGTLNDRYITSAYIMAPIIRINKVKEDSMVYSAEYVFDFTGKMNYEAYPQSSSYDRANELWEKSL